MKKIISIFALALILGCANLAFGQCVFKETFTVQKGEYGYTKDYPISLDNETYKIEYKQTLDKENSYFGVSVGLFNKKKDPTGESRFNYVTGSASFPPKGYDWETDYHKSPNGNFTTKQSHRFGEIVSSYPFTNQNFTTLRISFRQGVALNKAATGSYEIRIVGGNCNKSSVNNNDANSGSNKCVFKETFTIPQGQNGYLKEYPVSLGNGTYRVEFSQNLTRDRMHPGFNIGFFNNRTDPTGENWTKYISGGSHSNAVRDKDPNIAYWTWATAKQPEGKFRAGEFVKSDDFTNKNYTTLRISYWQGVGALAGAIGKYEIRIIGPGCSSGSSSSNENNNPPVSNPPGNNPPPTSSGSRTVKLFFYKPKRGENRCYTNLVSVNRQISGSQSVLRESLNALFAENGSAEMENYTAGLSLVSLNITNGVANIVLTGSQNSPCASLFEEQVRKTAMQFPTVKDVSIEFQ